MIPQIEDPRALIIVGIIAIIALALDAIYHLGGHE